MSGRQAHGRSLTQPSGATGNRNKQRSKAKTQKKALDAFAIASRDNPERQKLTPRNRELNADFGAKRPRAGEYDDEDEEDEDEDEGPPRKMRRGARDENDEDSDIEYGSDSSGNEWKTGVDGDDDSDIDSDDAFGESDEERFEGYAFGGSKKKAAKKGDDSGDDSDADGASLGSDAIELADALDMSMSDDDAENSEEEDDGSSDDDESDSDDSGSGDESSEDEDEDVDGSKMKDWITKFAGADDEDEEASALTKAKIGLKDLGLLGVKDPELKKSLKLLSKEEKSSKPQKLDAPLARRQQAQLDRSAAYDQTSKTLDRWTETVKQNRRADHLMFPLPQTETGLVRHDNSEIQPLNQKAPGTELEQTILSIMEQSGLGPSAEKAAENELDDDEEAQLSRKLLWQQKRRERELKSREEARSKRIKKIKSKAYRRVHRKQREGDELKEHEARAAAGEIDSEEEREAQDRQRAMERMGARHKESKWAKQANKNGRAAWDDDVRLGIADMARRDEELRRRIEGRATKGDDSDDEADFSGDSDDIDERKRLLKQLKDVEEDEAEGSGSKLMNMAFMKKAEAAKKKANDALIADIRRELASDQEDFDGSEPEAQEVGRKMYGLPAGQKNEAAIPQKKSKAKEKKPLPSAEAGTTIQAGNLTSLPTASRYQRPELARDAWATAGPPRKQKNKKPDSSAPVIDIGSAATAETVLAPEPKPKPSNPQIIVDDDRMSDDEESHNPIHFREQELLDRAFGGLDAVGDFEKEKREIEEEDDEKVVDNTLPGWGSWVGEGVSAREKKNRHSFLTKKEGIKKNDRKDAKLDRVIISEKKQTKNTKYLASQLPHQYESTMQYERSLRLPVGPEWVTKETYQNQTKPRVLVKQGIIKPMEKPMH